MRGPYNKKEKSLHLRGKHVLFTYPQCGVDLKSILDQLTDKLAQKNVFITNHIIAHELHEDGNPHRHVYLVLTAPLEYVKPSDLDISGNGKTYHGKYESCRMPERVVKYCTKDGHYLTDFTPEQIEKMSVNSSSTWNKDTAAKALMAGTPVLDVLKNYPSMFFQLEKVEKNLRIYKKMNADIGDLSVLENEWIWGPTGTGKSKSIRERYPEAYTKNKESFWNGYDYQQVVHIEDVDYNDKEVLDNLKNWVDYYKFEAKIKHEAPITIRPKKIIITSNMTIEETFTTYWKNNNMFHDTKLLEALKRRFKEIRLDSKEVHEDLKLFPDDYFLKDIEISYDKYVDPVEW